MLDCAPASKSAAVSGGPENTSASGPELVFVGDLHGMWHRLEEGLRRAPVLPKTIILLGGIECERPLDELAAPIRRRGIALFWIPGNHAFDGGIEMWRNLTDPGRNAVTSRGALHGRVVTIGGKRVAGLGGTFRGPVWHPPAAPRLHARGELPDAVQALCAGWPAEQAGALSLSLAGLAIWPEDVERLATLRADILVTHEAPSSHPLGFAILEQLARQMGATLLVHGHHHVTYRAVAVDGLRVRGVAAAGGMADDGRIAWPGEPARNPMALSPEWQLETE